MSVIEIKQNIEDNEDIVKSLQKGFIRQRQQIVDAIKPFVKEHLKKEVEDQVRRNPEHTKSIGKDALSAMKKRLTELLENSDNMVEDVFSDDSFWMHINYKILPNGDRFGQGYNNRKTAKDNIYKGIKLILGEAGRILIDNEYLSVGGQYRWDPEVRYDYTRADKGRAKLVYAYSAPVTEDIEQLIEEYCNSIGKLHKTLGELMDLQKRLSEQEAVDLWNEV